jgi:hypothetical protein
MKLRVDLRWDVTGCNAQCITKCDCALSNCLVAFTYRLLLSVWRSRWSRWETSPLTTGLGRWVKV